MKTISIAEFETLVARNDWRREQDHEAVERFEIHGDIMNRHALHDKNSLEIHKLVANKIIENPMLIDRVRVNLEEARQKLGNTRAREEWDIVLMAPVEVICDFISQDNEHVTRMRQSSPFIGIITKTERSRIYEQVFSGASNSCSQSIHGNTGSGDRSRAFIAPFRAVCER